MVKSWRSIIIGIGVLVIVFVGSYVSTKAGINGSAQPHGASQVVGRIALTRAEEALRPHQHRSVPSSLWLDAAR